MNQVIELVPIYSDFGSDDDLQELIELFVDEIPQRIAALRDAAERGAVEDVRRLAHQLKGAGGSYGFQQITEAAARLELRCGEGAEMAAIETEMEILAQLCLRIRCGSAG